MLTYRTKYVNIDVSKEIDFHDKQRTTREEVRTTEKQKQRNQIKGKKRRKKKWQKIGWHMKPQKQSWETM